MTRANPAPRLRAAAYCRIAGGEEQSAILESQKTCYTERIGANPDWIMAGIFADIGDSRSKRPEFQKMLRRCRQKKIDLILVKSVSRFARNMVDCLSIVRELRELGVTVIFEQENISTTDPSFDVLASLTAEFTRAECEHLTMNSAHTLYMGTISRPTKRTWKKTIRLPGRPEKTIIFRME
ncbi:MAG: recombinase family protein [Oscillibacter sp.]|jgi:DNA invertase Pin-like site-specific DNA recombinase|nr:recombinase family protein [Oscillibacter sp.]